MAIAKDTVAEHIKPLDGAVVRRYTAGATIAAGQLVQMSDDGFIDPCDATGAASYVLGVAVNAAAITERVDVVVRGPVVCMTGATIGSVVYSATDAGEPTHTAGTYGTAAGIAESAAILLVRPGY